MYVQNQTGTKPRQWGKSGKVLEVLPHDSFLISIDGSYNVTKRNRKFLRKFTPLNFSLEAEHTSENSQKSIPAPQLQTGTPLPPISPGPVQNTPADPVLSVPSQPNSFPEVPIVQFPPEGNASEEHQSFQVPNDSPQQHCSLDVPTNQDAQTSVGQTPRRQLPPHLRERWVFDPNYHPTNQNQTKAMCLMLWIGTCIHWETNPTITLGQGTSNHTKPIPIPTVQIQVTVILSHLSWFL